ncbi:MAG: hypothetical protein J1F02_06810 [Lachnospiraceae bacterium]|nr:hypothetical protein [Lachnospiraceae bacterium]
MLSYGRKKIYIVLFFVIVAVVATFYVYKKTRINAGKEVKSNTESMAKNNIKLLKNDSYFDKFYIKENKVFIKCELVIQNSGDKDEYIKLRANMESDYNNGLLKSPIVYGYNKKGNDEFLVPANSKKEYNVSFIGDFAGKKQKSNRNLPSIEIIDGSTI